jgi:hypothetical protein
MRTKRLIHDFNQFHTLRFFIILPWYLLRCPIFLDYVLLIYPLPVSIVFGSTIDKNKENK